MPAVLAIPPGGWMPESVFRLARRCRVIIVSCALLSCMTARAADITLLWDANSETNLSGYKVYYGTASRTYLAPIVLGKQTSYTITGLAAGTYYFAVTAFDTTGSESDFSNEVSRIIGTAATGCDVNGDGAVDALDVQALVNIILGKAAFTAAADLNRDNKADQTDLDILTGVVLGQRVCP